MAKKNLSPHIPVCLEQILQTFSLQHLHTFVDGTLGAGGHALAILEKHPEIELFIGIDRDLYALDLAKQKLQPFKDKVRLLHGNYSDLSAHLHSLNIATVDGLLFDLGVSSMQLDLGERGFSFSKEALLDMRMNTTESLTAATIINSYSQQQLATIFRDYGEERYWKEAAAAIVEARRKQPIHTTGELARVLLPIVSRGFRRSIHPLTLVFQGLRIAVNGELMHLERLLPAALGAMHEKSRLAVISFHSLEDRQVKQVFQQATQRIRIRKYGAEKQQNISQPQFHLLSKKPLIASREEQKMNSRSRSAKLRSIEKISL